MTYGAGEERYLVMVMAMVMGGTCTTGWKLSLENGSSFGRRQRWGIEAPTKTHLIVIMMVLRVVSREISRIINLL